MQQVLVCKNCDAPLSKPVVIYREADGKRKGNKGRVRVPSPTNSDLSEIVLYYKCEKSITPVGRALEAVKLIYERETHPLHFRPQFYLTLEDILPHVGKNKYWQEGCCGAGVSDFPNRSCKCGKGVGFELSECFTVHVFIPNNKMTKWKNVKS